LEELNDLKFVRRLIKGDAAAFAHLCLSLSRKLPEFIARAGGLVYADAEEVASDVLVKIHDSIREFEPRPDTRMTTWIFKIAKRAAIDRKRKLISESKKMSDLPGQAENLKRPAEYEAAMLGEEQTAEAIRSQPYKRAFNKLNEQEKEILMLKRIMSYEEISDVKAEQVGALRTRHFRALRHLREEVRNILEEESDEQRRGGKRAKRSVSL
jgi:RNA polymerase sigma factor (sigma-70 family)